MIIDFHTHIFAPEIINNRDKYVAQDPLFKSLYADKKAKLAGVEDLIHNMDEQEIDFSVVQNFQWSDPEICHQSNQYIIESVGRYPRRLSGFGMISFESPAKALREIEFCAQNGLKGIGEIRPAPDILKNPAGLEPIVQSLIFHDLMVCAHSSEPLGHLYPGKGDITPQVLYPFISAFPGLKLVCAHWGGGLPFYSLIPEVKKALGQVYFDSAASPYLYGPQIYRQAAQLAGAEKVLFGSDYPLLKPRRLLAEIETLALPEEIKQQLLSGNARKLLEI